MNHFLAALLLFLIVECAPDREVKPATRPNILIILTDDQGFEDAGFQGSPDILTPNLDTLARNGVIFTDAHVTATVCSPSRAGIMTGRYQQQFGHEPNVPPRHTGTDTTQVTIADVMVANGYRTSLNGKWHLGSTPAHHPNSRGFEHFFGILGGHRTYFADTYPATSPNAAYWNRTHVQFPGDYFTDAQGDSAIAYLKQVEGDPFFLFLSFIAPHAPMDAKPEDLELFKDHQRPEYAAMMWAMDRAVGNVVTHLKATGQFDNTLIIFLSDNGGSPVNDSSNLPLKGFKGNKFEGGHRVPFFVHWPARVEGGRRFDGLTSSLDLFPTTLAAAGITKPADLPLDGVNLLPFLDGTAQGDPHEQLFFRKEESAAVRMGDWKLIRVEGVGYAMYDLSSDPGEMTNLVDADSARFQTLKAALEQWETRLIEPWWEESRQWQDVTREIHESLMKNEPVKRVSP